MLLLLLLLPNYIQCAYFAPLSRRRQSGANHIPCAVPALLSRFPVISSKKKGWPRYPAHPRRPLRLCAPPCASAPPPAPLRRPLLPHPTPPLSPARRRHRRRPLMFTSLFYSLVLCIPKKDNADDDGPAAHPAEAVPHVVDNDGSAELTQMVLFVIGAFLLLLFCSLSSSSPSSSSSMFFFCS